MKKFDYRHIVCIAMTVGFVLVSVFVFSNAFDGKPIIDRLEDLTDYD